jgi:hypothetical protein
MLGMLSFVGAMPVIVTYHEGVGWFLLQPIREVYQVGQALLIIPTHTQTHTDSREPLKNPSD